MFWYGIKELSEKAVKILLFPISYLCESRFSPYTSIKTTHHSRLNAEADVKNPTVFFLLSQTLEICGKKETK